MGRHSNLILVDAHRRVIAAAKTVRPNESKRPIRPNHPYEPPPFDPKPPLNEAKPGDNLRDYEGFSPMVDRLLTNGFDLIQIQQAVISQEWQPHFSELAGAYPINFSPLDPTAVPRATLSIALENTFALRETADTSSAQAHALRIQIQRVIDARRTALAGLDEALNTADNAASIQLEAELILAYQGSIKPHQTELEAYDYSGKPLKIRLNPEKNAVENANARFEKAKHAKERRGEVAERHARISHELAAAEALLHDLDLANSPEDLERIHATAKIHNFLHEISAPKAKEDRPYEGFSIRELTSPSGYRVLYGTNATSNDYLTNRVAKGNDIWLHVRGQTSAHVIIQSRGEPDRIQRSDLEFAAIVSARNSVAKHGSYVPVDYTLKKYVRKPRGSAPGLAVYEREKTIHVDP
jgi:predicted ribosome quality control (RQC) complex YloA/Tae2 family protein